MILNESGEGIDLGSHILIHEYLGDCYRGINDYLQALGHYTKALAIVKKEKTKNLLKEEINFHCEIGECYRFLFKEKESIRHLNIAFDLTASLPEREKQIRMTQIHENMGLAYNYFDNYQKAIYHFKSSISLAVQVYGKHSKRAAMNTDLLGNSYYYLKDYPQAIRYFEEAASILKKDYSSNQFLISGIHSKIGACYTNLEQYEKATHFHDLSIKELDFDPGRDYPFEILRFDRSHLLITLYFKAKNHQKAYEAGWGIDQLYEASRWFDWCIELIGYINSTFEESGSKQYLLARFYYIFEAAINSRYHLYQETDSLRHLGQAFGLAERSKALLLKEAMQLAGAAIELDIPESLLEEERRLKKAIIERENARYERRQRAGEAEEAVHELNSEIFDLREAYRRVMDSIQQRYPESYRLRYATEPLRPEQVQAELLAPEQGLVQYFVGEDNIFVFVISREKAAMHRLLKGEGFEDAVHAFRESIYSWSRFREDTLGRQYADLAYQLYQKLVEPVAPQLPERLIIIPDGLLEHLPFEALLLEPVGPGSLPYSSYPYLIRKYQLSYAHSARLLREMKAGRRQAPRPWVLAFAPSFQDAPGQDSSLAVRRRSLGKLTGNTTEVQAIKRLWRTRICKGQDATRERFLADAPHYGILHLATHAKANDEEGEYSYLAFTELPDTIQNELLYVKDLYSLRLNADMVVLSACESGVGELRRGEGVISLARGFAHAGARSLATTLWRVSDQESARLMGLFYEQLKEGRAKDEAMRNAKLQFLAQSGPELAHPFFWAAFTLTGDMAPLEAREGGGIFPAWVFALFIGLFVFLALRFAKRKTS